MDNSIETTRRQKLQAKAVPRSRFSLPPGIRTQTSNSETQDDGQSTPLSPTPGIYSASSQDSTHTTNSVASRRQRIMAISAKNKAHRRSFNTPSTAYSPKAQDTDNDVDSIGSNNKNYEKVAGRVKPPSWQSPQSKNTSRRVPPEPIDTQYNNNGPSSNGRASPLPPPPPPPLPDTDNSTPQAKDVEHANEHASMIKSWSEREQKDGHVVAFPSPKNWKGKSESPSSARQQRIGNRVVVAPSPTASMGSVESSFSSQPRNISKRSFSSPKYGSPQPRYSTGNKNLIEPQTTDFRNLLKPVRKEPEVQRSHEKEAYGAIIETPEKSSVSSLHAMFDSQNAVPLMPMNSTNSIVRHSLPIGSPVTPSSVKTGGSPYRSFAGRSNVRNSFDEYAISSDAVGSSFTDDRSVASVRSSSSGNRPRHPVVASWSQKRYAEKNEQQNARNKSYLPSKTVPKDNKSRVRQYYNSSWRMESPVNEKSESKDDLSQETEGQKLNSHDDGDDKFKPAKLRSSWQERCRPKPIETDAQEAPIPSTDVKGTPSKVKARKSVERGALSPSLVSLMYSTKNEKSDKDNQKTMDWPCDTSEKETDVEDNVTDIILDSLTDIIPNDIKLPPMLDPAPDKDNNNLTTEDQPSQEALQGGSSGVKPWENDTKHSVVQSWQNRSSKPKDSASAATSVTGESKQSSRNETEGVAASNCGDVAAEDQIVEKTVEEVTNDTKNQSELLETNSSSDSYIEEKKSNDLSFDEDEILGQDIDGRLSQSKVSDAESSQHGDQSTHHTRKQSFYDDDSYLSRGGDTEHTPGLCQSNSALTASARSRTSATTYNSEDMSLYVEDERIISKKEDKIVSAQFVQMNLGVAVGESEVKVEEKKKETTAPALSINVDSTVKPNLPRLNPSPKDCDVYRSRFFDDSGGPTAKSIRDIRRKRQEDNRNGHEDSSNKNSTPVSKKNYVDAVETKKLSENQVFDVWASTSNEERDEAIKFDETNQWLDRDPDIEDSIVADDISDSSDHDQENVHANRVEETPKPDPEPRPILIKKPPQSLRTLQKQQAKALINNARKAKQQQPKPKQDVFDPFGIDAEETNGLTVETDDLFSSNPDPFMTNESFSPLEWSTPGGSNTNTNKDNAQHIGYYNSPDSRVEI